MARVAVALGFCLHGADGVMMDVSKGKRSSSDESCARGMTNFVQLDEKEVHERGSYCLFGNMPGFWYEPAQNNASTKWVIALQGDGWCKTEEECAARVAHSWVREHPAAVACPAVFMGDAFEGFHLVNLYYCDGGLFAGDRAEPIIHEGLKMYLRGKRILDHILATLVSKFGFSDATEVLFTGGSSGALSLYLSADYIGSQLPASVQKYGVAPNNGFWARPRGDNQKYDELEAFAGPMIPLMAGEDLWELGKIRKRYLAAAKGGEEDAYVVGKFRTFKKFVDLHNIGGTFADGCKHAMQGNRWWHCVFADISYRYSRTPMFVLQNVDEFVVMNNQTSPDAAMDALKCMESIKKDGYTTEPNEHCNASIIDNLNEVIDGIQQNLASTEKYGRPGEGGFLSTCNYHSSMMTVLFQQYGSYDAVAEWFKGNGLKGDPAWRQACRYNQHQPYQCDEKCGTLYHPPQGFDANVDKNGNPVGI